MMLRYHPERYRVTRPFAKQVVSYYKSNVSNGMATERDLQEVQRLVFRMYNQELLKLPVDKRPDNTRLIAKELSYSMHYSTFTIFGRNIFNFEQDMIDSFKHTDIDQVPNSALSFPYPSFYMSFGKQLDLELWGEGYFVDGAYIIALPGLPLQILLSTIRENEDYKDETYWITNPDRYYYLSLDIEDKDQYISSILDTSLENELKSKDLSNLPDYSGVYEIEGKHVTAVDVKNRSSKLEVAETKDGFVVFQEALKLVINGICYISSYLDDIEERWPDDAPSELIEKVTQPSKKSNYQKAKASLLSMGYTQIKYCGKKFIKENVTLIPSGGGEKSSHWRRGHWRNQAHGEGHKLRRLIWIMPMIIRKDKSMPEQGHIYTV
jgi:hypothetical protein